MDKKYVEMKVFDWQDMSEDAKKAFRFICQECGHHKDSYVCWTIHDEVFEDENDEWALSKKKVDAWLIENGAKAPKDEDSEGEQVLISYWW